MADDDFVSVKALAERLAMDRSAARKYVIKLGYAFHKRRTQDSGGQLTLCLSESEAEEVCAQRTAQGFVAPTVVAILEVGVFYVIQLVPELDPKRIKLGFAESLEQRLAQHRTAAPTAKVLHAWACKRSWELTAMDALTRMDCQLILNEVFECGDPLALVKRGEAFFAQLPKPSEKVPVAPSSPLKRLAGNGEISLTRPST